MCELECGCDYKPLEPIERRNDLGYDKPCILSSDACGHFRKVRRDIREQAASFDGQMKMMTWL